MIAVVDYGVGNLFSLVCSLGKIGAESKVVTTADELKKADKIILPGVGAFADAAEKLRLSGMRQTARRCSAYALACSCCSTKVWNTASTAVWGW